MWRYPALALPTALLVFAAGPACSPIDADSRELLVGYVHEKYHIPSGVHLNLIDRGFVHGTCHRKVSFTSQDNAAGHTITLYLSADSRFLTPELFDSRFTPADEAREMDQSTMQKLKRSTAATSGPATAPILITIFSDFECPFCRQFANTLREKSGQFGDDARIVFRNFPLPQHGWARSAARAAACVAAQDTGAFWRIHDFLFEHQAELTTANIGDQLRSRVNTLQTVDAGKYDRCMNAPESNSSIDADIALGNELGVNSTPTVFVNAHRIAGVPTPEQFASVIQQMKRQLTAAR